VLLIGGFESPVAAIGRHARIGIGYADLLKLAAVLVSAIAAVDIGPLGSNAGQAFSSRPSQVRSLRTERIACL
jgi:hypothetical protein